MKKALALVFMGTVAIGCGGGSDGDDDTVVFTPDASTGDNPDATPVGAECNAVSQTGCQPGEKCGFILDQEEPRLGHVGCTADGTAAVGEACTAPTVGNSDSCAAGGHCYIGECQDICTQVSPDCADGFLCVSFVDIDYQWCLPACDPIAQDCPDTAEGATQGCYLGVEGSSCVRVFGDGNAPGDGCEFLNECAPGGGCFGDPGQCLRYCSRDVCPPQLDEMGNVVAWCGPDADPPCTCAGGAAGSGMECLATESCQGIQGEEVVGVCADLSGG